jgi:hypothetical protein
MHDIASLVETYLAAESQLVTGVELAGGAVALPDSRTALWAALILTHYGASVASGRGLSSGRQAPMYRGVDQHLRHRPALSAR